MAEVTVVVCDVCGALGKPTKRYTVGSEEVEPIEKVLCATHGGPLDNILGSAPVAPQRPAQRPSGADTGSARRRARRTPVVTLEEIEARKASQG